jgi:hypothetical protein
VLKAGGGDQYIPLDWTFEGSDGEMSDVFLFTSHQVKFFDNLPRSWRSVSSGKSTCLATVKI